MRTRHGIAPRGTVPRGNASRMWAASLLLVGIQTAWSTPLRAEETPAGPAPSAKPSEPAKAATTAPTASKAPASTEREQQALDAAKRRQAEAERAGDSGLARRLAALSTRILEVIDALEAAAKLEAEAAAIEDERIRVQEQTDRLISLVEQTEARRARALARLQALGLEPGGTHSAPPSAPAPTKSTGGAQ